MSLSDYAASPDHFEAERGGLDRLSFPCWACVHQAKRDTEHPCRVCGHNISAMVEDRGQQKPETRRN